ncbi:ribonuclease H-like domain-containing protein [Favolaschia claudopus]|uniref:Ribonuclease H-like domain-containing protein n=1 Tax=Favolaschia claudopus TaxID=2862362 RepID=A0AAW0ADR9_9AGAR
MPKTPKKTTSKPKTPYTITKGHKRGLLAQSGKATLENIVALQQHGLKANGKAFDTTKKYDEAVAAGLRWLEEYVGGKAEGKGKGKKGENKEKDDDSGSEGSDDESDLEEDVDRIAPDAGEFQSEPDGESSFKFDNPAYRRAFNAIPNVHSPEMVSLYLVYKIYGQGRKNRHGRHDSSCIQAYVEDANRFRDGDKYRGKWHFNPTTAAWEGNPIDSAKVQDTMAAIENKCGKDGGDRKHSCCFELTKLQRKHLTLGLEDSKAFNTPYFELQLTNRKGWQKRVNQSHKEADLRSGKFKICAQSGLPACDSFSWMTRWVKYLEEEIYQRPLKPEDYIFPATGANGIVQTGEHISHDDVQKWITEFASGADLPRANGTFSTHCFRRGGAQYRFMFAPVGRRWTLRQLIIEQFQRDTLIKYLLDELNTYEDDYSGMLLPTQPDTDKTLLGEASLTAPATAESITMLHQSLSSDIRALSSGFEKLLRIVAESISAPVEWFSQGLAVSYDDYSLHLQVKLGSAKPSKRKGPETVADDEPPTKKKPGPRANSLLDRLSSADIDNNKSTANKSYWTCIADGCSHRRAGRRTAAEVLTHALRCDFLRKQYPVARKEAEDEHARNALGAEKAADPQTSPQDQPRPVGRPRNLETDEKGQGKLDQSSFRDAGRKKSKEEQETWQRKADHLLMLLICKSGLIPHLLDKEDWAAFVTHLNPSYVVTGSKKFLNEYIPQEAALVKQKTKAALQDSRDLTYTSDGTSIRRGDQFYTAHACTPSRDVYFLGGQFGTKDSHNAEWIKNGAIAKMQEIGLELWASMVTDSTNVTLAARRGVTKEAPTILDLCDVIHFLQHIIGDINELPEYQSMMEALKLLLRHFSKSGKSKDFLRDSGEGMADDGGKLPVKMLAKIGKTRFATHYMSVNTVSPAARNIQSLVLAGKIKFKYSIANSLDSRFQTDSGISKELTGHVRAIFNKRYHQFFSHSDAYFVAFCLDPRFPNAEYLRPRPKDARPKDVPEHILYPHAFFRVKEFLKKVLRPLVELHETHDTTCRCHPVLKIPDFDFSETLKLQLEAFWLGEPPFHAPVIGDDTMEWWTNLGIGNSPRSNVIAMLAVRIFGILVNSMPDECTNSTITWFNSPLRGNQQQEGLLDMIMVGQWHKYHAPGAKGPRRTPRRPTIAFRRLDKKVIEKTKMKMREEASDSDASDSDADSEEITEQDQAELQKLTDTLRAKIAGGVKRSRKKKHQEDL